MDMFNRIKSTVSSFSTVLPGNPVTREYEVIEHLGSAGPGLLWKVYRGFKKSTKEEASIFVLEKKLLEKYQKQDREKIVEIMKRGISNLTRLRHPSILTVQHSLEESRDSLAFATEPVFASLANILGSQENMPVPPPKILKDYELFDVEIKFGLLQIVEGLTFLHNDVKMIHRNINPESVVVNKNGAWKLAGFDFCMQSVSSPGSQEQFPFSDIEVDQPPPCMPHFDFLAPECGLSMTSSPASDMFSYGALIYAVYNKGRSVLNNCGSVVTMKNNFKQLKNMTLSTFNVLPAEFRDHVKLLLNPTPELRPDAFQTAKLPMFEDVGVKTLQYLDSLYQWDNLQKSHFYKGLPQIISKMPKRVTLFRVLPCLAKEYCVPEMVPFVLPSVLMIAEEATKEEFQAYIIHDMVPLFRIQEPVQIMLIFMQKMELLLKKCTKEVINNHVLPMIYRALEADAQQIQELCLSIIPRFAGLVEYSAMKNALIPRIKKLCISTNFLSVRVNCLVCLGKLLDHLDKWLVLDEILPFLPQIPSKEPAVLMGVLGILKLTMSHKKLGMTKEVMATKIIPFLMPLSIENGLTLSQFNAIMSVVKEMVCRVESDHKTKLEQLNSIRQEQGATLGMAQIPTGSEIFESFPKAETNASSDVFKDLGLSSFGSGDVTQFNSNHSMKNGGSYLTSYPGSEKSQQKDLSPLSLSLEEKKKLAWEQEQQQNFKTQQNVPLSASANQITASAMKTSATNSSRSFAPPAPMPGLTGMPFMAPNVGDIANQSKRSPVQTQSFAAFYQKPMQAGLQRQGSQTMPSNQNFDLSSLDNLLPSLSRNSRTPLNQMSSIGSATPFQSLAMQQPAWTGPMMSTTPLSPIQSGPQSLPSFATSPAKSPKNDINDLLG